MADAGEMDPALMARLVRAQRNEITEYHVYQRLAQREKDPRNREVLEQIARDERSHYEFWAERTGRRPGPRRWQVAKYVLMARLLGLTFAVKLMEKGEQSAEAEYADVARSIPQAAQIVRDEEHHEQELMAMIDEERLRYVGSVVLGLSDALVELTGALAGLTLALQKNRLIAMIAMITGIAAALSMAASEYLSTKAEQDHAKSPRKAATYTGIAYIFAVGALILPYLLLASPILAIGVAITAALLIILAFAFYISVARDVPLSRRFGEMAALSLGVAAISFGIGYLLRLIVGVDV
jgi:VIT1/CCC1 family predicted Fe2+/Mn2+ transporter